MNEQEINSQFEKQFGAGGFNPSPIPLPNAVSSLVLGIIGTFFGLIWCYWVGSVIGLVCSIIAIMHARKAKALYEATPQSFKPDSMGNVNAGRVLGIIGLCLSLLWIVFAIVVIAIALSIGGGLGRMF